VLFGIGGRYRTPEAVADHENFRARMLVSDHVNVCVEIEDIITETIYVTSSALGMAVPPVVHSADPETRRNEFIYEIEVTAAVFCQSMNDNLHGPQIS
jgi:hypothetical protein